MYSSNNHFVLDIDQYKRDLNVQRMYIEQTSTYLNVMTGRSYKECWEYVEKVTGKGGEYEFSNPEVFHLKREQDINGGDKEQATIGFMDYLKEVSERGRIMSPTMAVYENPRVKTSILSDFIVGNMNKRKKEKKAKFAAELRGDEKTAALKHILQSTYKIKNNSLSGAHASPYTMLYNKSSHSTLTSTCRSATAYANANNERFLFGNRHYFNLEIAVNDITAIITYADYKRIAECVRQFNLHIPTVDEVCDGIKMSTDQYWRCSKSTQYIRDYISNLSDIQRVAYHYTSNFYTLRKHNNDLVRDFLNALTTSPDLNNLVEDPDYYIDLMDSDLEAYVSVICAKYLNFRSIGDVKKEGDHRVYAIVATYVKKIKDALEQFSPIIRSFWVASTVPSSIANFTTSLRKGVLVSDTDSTIFTVQDWVQWMEGDDLFSDKANAVCAAMIYIASQTTIHVLALLSTNMGVVKEKLFNLAMKNEFLFPVMILTSRAKHYTSYISTQEGNVKRELEHEVKGVTLKNSKIPKNIMNQLDDFIKNIMDTVMRNEKVSIKEELTKVANIEREIKKSIFDGEIKYLSLQTVKTPESYVNPDSSVYMYYKMWEEVFAPDHGQAPPPTYSAVKISLNVHNSKNMQAWLGTIEEGPTKERLINWLTKSGKLKGMTQIVLPIENIVTNGIPEILKPAIDIRKIIYSLCEAFYLMLESLEIFMQDKNITKLVSDYY